LFRTLKAVNPSCCCEKILINVVVKSWAAGNLGNTNEQDEESGGVLESHGNSRKSYLQELMGEANMEGLEISSKFKFLLDTIEKASSKRILIFLSWYVNSALYYSSDLTVNGFFYTVNCTITTVNGRFSTVISPLNKFFLTVTGGLQTVNGYACSVFYILMFHVGALPFRCWVGTLRRATLNNVQTMVFFSSMAP